jgi:hypothetical protein
MLMKCSKCNKNIEVSDDAYFLYKRAINNKSIRCGGYTNMWERVHPLTCACGGILHDIPK